MSSVEIVREKKYRRLYIKVGEGVGGEGYKLLQTVQISKVAQVCCSFAPNRRVFYIHLYTILLYILYILYIDKKEAWQKASFKKGFVRYHQNLRQSFIIVGTLATIFRKCLFIISNLAQTTCSFTLPSKLFVIAATIDYSELQKEKIILLIF